MGKITQIDIDWMNAHPSMPRIIGSLIHAMVHTRPDIAYAVSLLSRSMSDPKPYHYKACKYVLRYLRATQDKCLVYDRKHMEASAPNYLQAFVDSSFADCEKTARSTSGFVVSFGGSPIEYEAKRQTLVTLSTMESEYVAASKCVSSIKYLKKLLDWLGIHDNPDRAVTIWEDNSACIAISTAPPGVHRSRSKHIAVKYHNVRESCEAGDVVLSQIWTEHQVADIFTKSLSVKPFIRFRDVLLGEKTLDQMMQDHMQPLPKDFNPKPAACAICRQCAKIGNYEPNYDAKWPIRAVPIQQDSIVALLNGMTASAC